MIKKTLIMKPLPKFVLSDSEIYDIEESEDQTIIKYSKKDPNWLKPNKTCVKYTNTGNGILIEFDKKKILIDYGRIEIIKILLNRNWENEYTHRMKK